MKKIIILMAIFSMFLMSLVSADGAYACTIIKPDSSDIIGTNVLLNVSFTGGEGNDTALVDWFFSSPSTANSSSSKLMITGTNISDAATNGSINITFELGLDFLLEDSNDYTVGATMNGTACSGSATSVILDRTKPLTPTTTQAVNSVLKAADIITYTIIGVNTTSCRISFQTSKVEKSSGTNTFAMVHSGNTCKYTIPSVTIGDGVYSMRGFATDGTNSSFSAPLDIEIDNIASNTQATEDGLQVGIGEAVGEKIRGETIGTVAIVIVVLYLIFSRKSGRKG